MKDCFKTAFELTDGEADVFGEIGDLDWLGVFLADVLHGGVHSTVGEPSVFTAFEVAHVADDPNARTLLVEQGELRGDVPGDGSIGIGDQLGPSQDGLLSLHDLFVILNVARDHIAGEEVVVGLTDEIFLGVEAELF